MSISYSGLRNYGKCSLPSVEAGLGSLNIKRDPPKSYYTKKRDKINDANELTQMIEDSKDRYCEVINHYARGVNPMVSVSYSNNSNNGGQNRNGTTGLSMYNNKQAYLPDRIGGNGSVVRPPILTQFNLLPLSRLPRNSTSVKTNKQFHDFTKRLYSNSCPEKTQGINKNKLNTNIRPTKYIKLDKPIDMNHIPRNNIQNVISVGVNSGVRTRDILNRTNMENISKLNDKNNIEIYTNFGSNLTKLEDINNFNNINTKNFIHNIQRTEFKGKKILNSNKIVDNFFPKENISNKTNISMISSKSNNINTKNISENYSNFKLPIKKNNDVTNYKTSLSKIKPSNYIHNDLQLDRNLPEHNAITNKKIDRYVNNIGESYINELDRNLPEHNAITNKKLDKYVNNMGESYISELDRNLPEHNVMTNKKIDMYVNNIEESYINELDRNLPEHSVMTNKKIDRYVNNMGESYISELDRNLSNYSVHSNIKYDKGRGEEFENRDVNLKETISLGNYHQNNNYIPSIDRFDYDNMSNQRNELHRKAYEEFVGRYERPKFEMDITRRY